MIYKVINPTIPKLEEISQILFNLRHYEKIWKEFGGFNNRKNVKYWQDKADKWLELNEKPKSDGDKN